MTSDQIVISQRNAQRLLGDPDFLSALEEVKIAYSSAWIRTAVAETAKREQLYHSLMAIEDIHTVLKKRAAAAKVRDTQEALAKEHGDRDDTDAS